MITKMISNKTVLGPGSELPSNVNVQETCATLFSPEEVSEFSVTVKANISTRQAGIVALKKLQAISTGCDISKLILHDDRNAPMVILPKEPKSPPSSFYDSKILLSLTDEDQYAGALAAVPGPHSALVGVGIDLANVQDFAPNHHSDRLFRGLFSSSELIYLYRLHQQDRQQAAAMLFSAKEAAIKCLAPLVRLLDSHSSELVKVPRFSDIDVSLCGPIRTVTFLNRAAKDSHRLGVARVECVCLPGKLYSLSVAKCIKYKE